MHTEILQPLYIWYLSNRRKLPWRDIKDPYLIWISEIILQQTRITQGLPYYQRFVSRFPDVKSLAEASEDEIMKIWEGLGYYSRARNLHSTACAILKNYNGIFPNEYSIIRKMKGIGDYTAAAVASIAFGQPYALADGNVLRVLSRYFGIETAVDTSAGKKYFNQLAQEILLNSDPGMHNQALMELGALICTPKNPDCQNCPVNGSCLAYANNTVQKFPLKSKIKEKITRHFNFILIESPLEILIEKRLSNDIWKNLYQLPLIETSHEFGDEEILNHKLVREISKKNNCNLETISPVITQILTHRKISARFIHLKCAEFIHHYDQYFWIGKKEISKFAFPVLIKKYLEKYGFN